MVVVVVVWCEEKGSSEAVGRGCFIVTGTMCSVAALTELSAWPALEVDFQLGWHLKLGLEGLAAWQLGGDIVWLGPRAPRTHDHAKPNSAELKKTPQVGAAFQSAYWLAAGMGTLGPAVFELLKELMNLCRS